MVEIVVVTLAAEPVVQPQRFGQSQVLLYVVPPQLLAAALVEAVALRLAHLASTRLPLRHLLLAAVVAPAVVDTDIHAALLLYTHVRLDLLLPLRLIAEVRRRLGLGNLLALALGLALWRQGVVGIPLGLDALARMFRPRFGRLLRQAGITDDRRALLRALAHVLEV